MMRFSFDGLKIVCKRTVNKVVGETLTDVVEFDAHVDAIPPHVMALLTPSERKELDHFLVEKERLQGTLEDTVVLEALPTLIEKVRGLLATLDRIDEGLHQQLTTSTNRLRDTLLEVQIKQGAETEKDGAMSAELAALRVEAGKY
jgi:hypothetical protein